MTLIVIDLAVVRKRKVLLAVLLLFLAGLVVGRQAAYRLYPLPYRETVVQRSVQYGLDPLLLAAVIRVESKWAAKATSHRGARGLMQVMPETGQWVGEKLRIPDFEPGLLYSPEYNLWVGAWYLGYLLHDFNGDLILALAAYNGGQTHVRQWLVDPGWTGERGTLEQIPFGETREFLRRVLRDRWRYAILYRRDGTPRF